MKKIILTSTLIAFFAASAFCENFDSLALEIIGSAGHKAENIGFVVRKVSDSKQITALNPDKSFIPASLQKLFTAAAALDKLGVTYRSQTKIYAEDFDRVTGEVKGDLYIVGAGDPGISAERLWLMAQYLRHSGIKSIPRRLVIDNSFFSQEETIAPGYGDTNNSRAYMSPISAFSVSFNSTSVVVQPSVSGENAVVHIFPPRHDVPTTGNVSTIEKGKELSVSTKKHPSNGMEILLGGTIKPNDKPKYVYRQVWEPVTNAGESFRAVARQVGIQADFTVAIGKVDTTKAELILSYDSEPLYESVKSMFKYSNNFTAEMTLLTLTAKMTKKPADWKLGSQYMQDWWKEKFPQSGEISVINGSGMGDGNQCSAAQISDLLCWSTKQIWFHDYISTMSIAGIDGTLSSRFKNSELTGNFRAKTGTLNDFGVSGLAGYFTANGEMYSAVFIANDRATSQYAKWILSEQLILGVKKAIEAKR
ncbi:MAG: D-alanyl-D-alanine carboxypeptidase/D-alanyl-D-alanine-endopeptidase [Chitinivibrionia bacterium]|nr:D-alanyl-D-alanine carboxypeptidase/D-alanyl-D-alanine-endopeptidase [Chitinivibrionia bacterium]